MTNTLLVVDDTPDNLRLLASMLGEQGYKVRLAPNGAHALTAARKEPPDLILLDILMPDMGGYDVCRALKADHRTHAIPIIFISALNEVFDKLTAFSVGGVDYITKPFEAAEVLARVKTQLTLAHLQRDLARKNDDLRTANETLEERVHARTIELADANAALTAEIEQRLRHQAEKNRLFSVVSQQSEQLRQLTNWLIKNQQDERQGLASGLQAEIEQNLLLLQSNVRMMQTLLTPVPDPLVVAQLESTVQILNKMQDYVKRLTTNLHTAEYKDAKLRDSPLVRLTEREREVLRLIAQGKNNVEVAELLSVASTTIYTYVARIKQKLDIPHLPGLIKFALEHQLVD